MAKINSLAYAFNRGLISKYGLARTDVRRVALSAEIQTNYIPKVLGAMSLRPGLGFVGTPRSNNQAINIPFVFETPDDTALLELTDSKLRVRVAEQLITRVAVSAIVANGDFASFVGWTDTSVGGNASASGGQLNLLAVTNGVAKASQSVAVGGSDAGKVHALRIVVTRGPITLRIGNVTGGDNVVTDTTLRAGTHSIAFIPAAGTFAIEFSSRATSVKLVDSCQIEPAGILELPTQWTSELLSLVRWEQSADVVFIACDGVSQNRIERRDNGSWSVVEYFPLDGPFRTANTTQTALDPSGQNGNITIVSTGHIFDQGHIGALFKLTSSGQKVISDLLGANEFTDPVQVTGIGTSSRKLVINISGTWATKLSLERSLDDGLTWNTTGQTFFNNQVDFDYNDGFDNQIIKYRLGFIGGDYVSGTASVTLANSGGGITGIVRITDVAGPESASAEVITPLGSVNKTVLWSEGAWSQYRGFTTAVAIHGGRLCWAGRGKLWCSVSDAYESFNEDIEGDSGTIARNIGRGPVDRVNWLSPVLRLIVGAEGSEVSTRSSALDEILTPANCNLKAFSTRGSAAVPSVIVDSDAFFSHRTGNKLMRISPSATGLDYETSDVSIFIPEILAEGVVRVAVQRLPETRIHCVLADGNVAILIFDDLENVQCWVNFHTFHADIEDVAILPGDGEDLVYYMVNRTVNGVQTRFLERWAFENQCVGGDYNYQADSHLVFTFGSPQNIISIPHLIGEDVVVWADGKDLSPGFDDDQKVYRVDGSGNITLDPGVTVSHAIVGLAYNATFQSSKLAYAAQMGTALLQPKIVNQVGIIAVDMHRYGVRVGQDINHLRNLPSSENGKPVDPDYIWTAYDNPTFPISGTWNTDARLVMRSTAPRPATILAAVISMQTDEKT